MEKTLFEILLIRHGQTDWNVQKKIMGATPVELNERGHTQARAIAEYLKSHPIQALYSSPHLRALQTAEWIARERGIEVLSEPRLRELEQGDWVGKTFAEVRASPTYVAYYLDPTQPMGKTGESLQQVQARAVDFVESLKAATPGRYALVTHADWIKCVLLYYMKMPLTQLAKFRIDNASLSCLHLEDKHERVICVNHFVESERLLGPREYL